MVDLVSLVFDIIMVFFYVLTIYFSMKLLHVIGRGPRGWWLLILGIVILLIRRALDIVAQFLPNYFMVSYHVLDRDILPLLFSSFLLAATYDLLKLFENQLRQSKLFETSSGATG